MSLPDNPQQRRRAAWALFLLTALNLLNFIDRYVVSALVEPLRREFGVSDAQLGLLATSFMLVYMLTSPLFGVLGDRRSRPPLIAAGIFIWSAATAAAGFARSFALLLVSRAAVGVGEASYATIAPGLLSDLYPPEKRGRVFAIFFAAIPIGAALGYIIGGVVDQHLGWRAAFLIAGIPGVLLAFSTLALRDPRGNVVPAGERAGGYASYLDLLRNRSYRYVVLGYSAYTFSLGALAFWMPAFLERVHGASRQEATVQFGAIVVVTGFIGTLLGGRFGDWLEKRTVAGETAACALVTLASIPFCIAGFYSDVKWVYLAGIIGAQLLLFAVTGPVNSALVGVVGTTLKTRAIALSVFLIHFLGDVPSPWLVGEWSDRSSLRTAFALIPVGLVAAVLLWGVAVRAQRTEAGRVTTLS